MCAEKKETPKLNSAARDFLRNLRSTLSMERDEREQSLSDAELEESRTALALRNMGLTTENLEERLGLELSAATSLAKDPSLNETLSRAETAEKTRVKKNIDDYRLQAKNLEYQIDFNAQNGFSDLTVRLATELAEGTRPAEALAPLPEKETFQSLVDDRENPDQPVEVFERQIVRTKSDVESPGFSSCAAVALFREKADGTPDEETIFAHLPPKTAGLGGAASSFKSYDAKFFAEQLGIPSLEGYRARVAAGVNVSPEDVASALRELGAKIDGVQQIPLDMFTIRLDAKTKTMVARGNMEEVVTGPKAGTSYRTEQGLPMHITDVVRAVEISFSSAV